MKFSRVKGVHPKEWSNVKLFALKAAVVRRCCGGGAAAAVLRLGSASLCTQGPPQKPQVPTPSPSPPPIRVVAYYTGVRAIFLW